MNPHQRPEQTRRDPYFYHPFLSHLLLLGHFKAPYQPPETSFHGKAGYPGLPI